MQHHKVARWLHVFLTPLVCPRNDRFVSFPASIKRSALEVEMTWEGESYLELHGACQQQR